MNCGVRQHLFANNEIQKMTTTMHAADWKDIAGQAQRKASAAKDCRDDALGTLKNLDARLRECMALGLSAAEAYDSFYQAKTSDALRGWVLGDA